MNQEQLNTFMKVMEAGSFNRASELLFVTPSAVMRQMNRLENELGLRLFERTNKGMKATVAGKYYHQEISRWYKEYEDIVANTKEIAKNAVFSDTIRVGVYGSLLEKFIKEYFDKFQEMFPSTQFEFSSYGIYSDKVMTLINDVGKNIDIVIENYEPWAIEEYHLQTLHLYDIPMSCAISINSDLYSKELLKMEDLFGRTVGIWNNKRSSIYYDMRKILGKYPEIKIRDISLQDEKIFDNKNTEIILGNITWSGTQPFYKFIPLDIDYKVPYGIWYCKHPTPKVETFIEKVKSIAF